MHSFDQMYAVFQIDQDAMSRLFDLVGVHRLGEAPQLPPGSIEITEHSSCPFPAQRDLTSLL